MNFSNLFRKKTVQDILKQVAKNEADGHNSLGKHLKTRDLAAFGIAAIIGAGIFSTIGKASFDGGPAAIFLFLFSLDESKLVFTVVSRYAPEINKF